MNLILWRHADAENRLPDEARQLTPKGRKQAKKMAEWLSSRLPAEYRVLVSPAARARETAAALTDQVAIERSVSTSATPQAVLKVAGWPDGDGTVIVVGHQPTLGAAAALALTGEAAAWSLKKGAIWWLVRDGDDVQVRAVLSPAVL
ncbi:MAG: histidine phosphatase family protein [Betaproteobacteria bacterium]|jgi:phosphohistidine phosphatase|nr:histidine phosphatase family protein [Betaproteobacteria bacterium]MDH5342189.1 histidine phosphatase family protein [Betaproteobacteria bacterium]